MTELEQKNLQKIDQAIGNVIDEEITRIMGKLDKYSGPKKIEMYKQLKTKFAETLNVKHANVISVKVPQPTSYDFLCYTPILVDEKAFNEQAFPLLEPEAFLNTLKQMVQVTDPNSPEAKRLPRVLITKIIENGVERTLTAEEERQYQEIEQCRIKVRENHYGIIGINEFVLVYLYNTFLQTGNVDILRLMRKIQDIMLRYNAHEPGICLGIEDAQLKSMRGISGIYAEIVGFYSSLTAANQANNDLATKQKTTPTQNASNTSSSSTGSSTPTKAKETDKENQTLAFTKKILAITTKKVVLDLKLPVGEFFKQVDALLEDFITAGLTEIDKARTIGVTIKYNINTNQWGSIGYAEMNELYLNEVYKQIQPYLPRHFKKSDLIVPRFYLKETITLSAFLGDFGYGNSVYSDTLAPGEEKELRCKIGEVEKTTRQQSQSALDSANDTTKQELSNAVEKATNATDSKAEQTEMYLDSQLKVNVKSDQPIVKVGVDVGVQAGYSNAQQTNHEESVNNIAKGFESHTAEKATKREVAVTDTRKEELERTNESGTMRKLRNQSLTQALNIIIRQMIQSYIVCFHITRIRLVFSNGATEQEFDISELKGFIAKYFKDDDESKETAKQLISNIQSLCQIVDYKGRVVKLLNEDGDRMVFNTYWDLLENQGETADDPEDLELQQYAGRIRGVLLKYNFMTMPVNGLAMYLALSDGRAAGDDVWQEIQYGLQRSEEGVTKLKNDNALLKAQVESMVLDNQAKAQEIEFIDSITDPNLKLQALFKLRNNKQQILDNAFVVDYLSRNNQRSLRF